MKLEWKKLGTGAWVATVDGVAAASAVPSMNEREERMQWQARVAINGHVVASEMLGKPEHAMEWSERSFTNLMKSIVSNKTVFAALIEPIINKAITDARVETTLAEREAILKRITELSKETELNSARAIKSGNLERGMDLLSESNGMGRVAEMVRGRTTSDTLSNAALKALVESRGMRVIESEPPVLEWNGDHGTLHGTPWRLLLDETEFVVFLSRQIVLRREYADGTAGDVAANRRAAEGELRSFGVTFRVDDEVSR